MVDSLTLTQMIDEIKSDLKEKTGTVFMNKLPILKATVASFDDKLQDDKQIIVKLKKSIKSIMESWNSQIVAWLQFANSLDKYAESETNMKLGGAFIQFASIARDISSSYQLMQSNISVNLLNPVVSLIKTDIASLDELKRNVDDSHREYKSKEIKLEKEQRKRTDKIDNPYIEISRRTYQLDLIEYLTKINMVKHKKSCDMLSRLIDFSDSFEKYLDFKIKLFDGIKTMRKYWIENGIPYMRKSYEDYNGTLQSLKSNLKSLIPIEEKGDKNKAVYNIHGEHGDSKFGLEKSGYLMKRSEGIRKIWQKRYCVAKDGSFTISHISDVNSSVTINLLTCQIKAVNSQESKKKIFTIITSNRRYLFHADEDADTRIWLNVLNNIKEAQLDLAFNQPPSKSNHSEMNSIKYIIGEIMKLPGNNKCVDCGAPDPTWISINFGVLVCIECSGIHREMGVHISRIKSLTLDVLGSAEILTTKAMGNSGFNEIMESALITTEKLQSKSTMDERRNFIVSKYVNKKYVSVFKEVQSSQNLINFIFSAAENGDLLAILHVFGQGFNLTTKSTLKEHNGCNILHWILNRENINLPILDFIAQNSSELDITDDNNETPLFIACQKESIDAIKLLVRSGADLNFQAPNKPKPAELVNNSNNKELIELIKSIADGKTNVCNNINLDIQFKIIKDNQKFVFDDELNEESPATGRNKTLGRPNSEAGMSNTLQRNTSLTVLESTPVNKKTIVSSPLAISPQTTEPTSIEIGTHVKDTTESIDNGDSIKNLYKPTSSPSLNQLIRSYSTSSISTSPNQLKQPNQLNQPNQTNQTNQTLKVQDINDVSSQSVKSDTEKLLVVIAMHNCEADYSDELSFRSGEVIVVTDQLFSDTWWKGHIQDDPSRSGLFPVTFVRKL